MALNENPTLEEIINEVDRLNNLIVNRGGSQTITPSTSNKTLNKGYYKGDITIKGDSNLVASNILSGKTIFGVSGNVVTGKRWASGSGVVSSNAATFNYTNSGSGNIYYIQIDGLAFTPSYIIADCTFNSTNILKTLIKKSNGNHGCISAQQVTTTNTINQGQGYRCDKCIFLSSSSVRIPISGASTTAGKPVSWIAFE